MSDPHVQSPGRRTGSPAIRPRHSPWRLAATVLGVLLLVGGLPLFVTPIPVGAVMIGGGLALLLRVSPHARLWRRALARRYPRSAARLDGLRGRWRRR